MTSSNGNINGWVNDNEAGDLRSSCAHNDVTVMRNIEIYCDGRQNMSTTYMTINIKPGDHDLVMQAATS